MALTLASELPISGTQLGRYTLLGKLAMGGMAEVFLARQDGPMGFAKTVVIKRILPQYADDQDFLRMFLDEARLAALISHPNVVQIFELGEDSETNTFFMAMEYIDGRNLKQVATRAVELGSQLSMRVVARIIADAAAGLDHAHSLKDARGEPLKLVHRDVSPENILISYGGVAKVVDFGIAKAAHIEGRTRTGTVKGKFGYMSPEILLGQPVDRRADVWALGITLYWLLAGYRPFRGESEGRIIQEVVSSELPALQRRGNPVPSDLEEIVRTSLDKNPDKRFQTAGEMQLALERWIVKNGEPVGSATLQELMEQLFPEQTDKDRVLTRALLQGEIDQQDTPWQERLEWQQHKASSRANTIQPPTPAPRWFRTLSAVMAGLILVAVALFAWEVFHDGSGRLVLSDPTPKGPIPPPANLGDDLNPATNAGTAAPAPPVVSPTATTTTLPPSTAPAPPTEPPATPHHKAPAKAHKQASARTDAEKAAQGPPGFLEVETRPWANVSIDGRRVGTTPMAAISLPSGKHHVDLTNDDLKAHVSKTVEIKPGETAHIREKLPGAE